MRGILTGPVALPIFHLGKPYPIFRDAQQPPRFVRVRLLAGLTSDLGRPSPEIPRLGHAASLQIPALQLSLGKCLAGSKDDLRHRRSSSGPRISIPANRFRRPVDDERSSPAIAGLELSPLPDRVVHCKRPQLNHPVLSGES
jgi:hypothetical protein